MNSRQWQPYTDEYGFIHNEPGEYNAGGPIELRKDPSQNTAVWTAQTYLAIINKINNGRSLPAISQAQFVQLWFLLEVESGLHERYPHFHEQEINGPDNLIALCFWAHLMGRPDMAERILDYGKKHSFMYYNNSKNLPFKFTKWFSSIMLRQPQIVAHIYFASKEKPPRFFRAIWVWEITRAAIFTRKKDTDGFSLALMLVKTAKGKGKYITAARNFWIKRFRKRFPGGWGEVLGAYRDDPHPKAVGLVGEFGE